MIKNEITTSTDKALFLSALNKRKLIFWYAMGGMIMIAIIVLGIVLYSDAVSIPIEVIGAETYKERVNDVYIYLAFGLGAMVLVAAVPCTIITIHINRVKSKVIELSDRSFDSLNKLNEKSGFLDKYFPAIFINDDYFEFQSSVIIGSKKFYFNTISAVTIKKGYYKGTIYLFKIETMEGTFKRTVKGNYHFVIALYLRLTSDFPNIKVKLDE